MKLPERRQDTNMGTIIIDRKGRVGGVKRIARREYVEMVYSTVVITVCRTGDICNTT